jgi:hypothetical protein
VATICAAALLVAACGSTTHHQTKQQRPTGALSLLQLLKQSQQGHGSTANWPEMPPRVKALMRHYEATHKTHGRFTNVCARYVYETHQWTVGACPSK